MDLRDESRKKYSKRDFTIDESEINTGCFQRMADAMENMAKNHTDLIREKERYRNSDELRKEYLNRAYRRISALQGVITRKNNEIKRLKNGSR